LFPADTGGKIRTLNIFARLAERAEVHVVSLADRGKDAAAIGEMRRVFASFTPVFWKEAPKFSPAFYAEFLASRLSRFPYFLAKYCVPGFREAAESQFARQSCDLMVCDFLQSAVALLDSPVRPRVIFEHNVEYLIRKQHWVSETNLLRKRLLRAEWEKARAIEARVCQSFDHVLAVSEQDQQTFAQEFGIAHATALPTGVNIEYFRPQHVQPRPGNVVFVGSMDWYPNQDGIAWFVREVYPHILREVGNASLTVVGRNPSPRLRELQANEPSVEVTGTVSDVRPYLAHAEVVIVPLRIGGGTRLKIFEAMAMARAVVSTSLGAQGLPVVPGREILLEDTPEGFARAVVALLNDPQRREAIGQAASETVQQDCTWQAVAAKMEAILQRVASTAAAQAAPATQAVAV
jgi:glycosyltransferase involved in cell wall biosynthesis